jgi:hypothetical protein
MACSKYILTNTGTSITNFSYRRCDNSMWEYQVELAPSETKSIWLINNTYSTAFGHTISLTNEGVFPPVELTPTPTPTATVTPSVTPTFTPTPSPTEPARYIQVIDCHSEASAEDVCNCPVSATVWTNGPDFASSSLAWSDPYGVNTGNPNGWYIQGGTIYVVADGCGVGCSTGSTISGDGVCGPTPTPTASVTPTYTPTPSVTTTQTPTGTPNVTPSPTPSSFGTNTFKVRVLSGGKAEANNFTLTETPYVGSSGVGFTGTTGSYPLNWSGGTNYGTHQQLSGDTVSFAITSSGNATLDIVYYKNGTIQTDYSHSVTTGSNTVHLYVANAASSDTIEFVIA